MKLNLEDCRAAYLNDPTYRAAVDMLIKTILEMKLTPAEVRSAGNLASILVEERRPSWTHRPHHHWTSEEMKILEESAALMNEHFAGKHSGGTKSNCHHCQVEASMMRKP